MPWSLAGRRDPVFPDGFPGRGPVALSRRLVPPQTLGGTARAVK